MGWRGCEVEEGSSVGEGEEAAKEAEAAPEEAAPGREEAGTSVKEEGSKVPEEEAGRKEGPMSGALVGTSS